MADRLSLTGYRYSVYTRAARMALLEKRLSFDDVEVDPFAETPDPALTRATPFGRVPVLRHGDFTIYETAAIMRYVDMLAPQRPLVPADPRAAGRMQQVIGIVDCYGYTAMVRQVFAHAVFRPFVGAQPDASVIDAGLAAAEPVLAALEGIAGEALQLSPETPLSLADLHLAPMMAYFDMAAQGRAMLALHPALQRWFAAVSARASFAATDPGILIA
ncbi:glutathione S-transferase family protein [Sulfitobacter sabulilitoris]|uniref:Glutathione S-transferase family protein n=1 Tax=Sulfitobacter sabulilitoris TaxID=2562655 RepID=A0A5S3PFD7_9RHOB|nr:glutathione S-transferase family protein [Sulfitobacter sabulilitoris]TMM52772.1 glutathione S-transferase family protein [Sulfitobacter sabulilitoris]